jgi:thermitase
VTATPNDPDYPSAWHLTQISAPSAWDTTTGSPKVTVAVIDSGADSTHPDLGPKLVPGWSFLSGTSNTSDTMGHGTATAGTVGAASNNGTGVASIAWQNPIMPLVVVDSTGYASYSNMASAITYAADHGARIVNMSLAGSGASSTLQSAVTYAWGKGTVVFASAGNYSTSTPYYPAACDYVLAISSTNSLDQLSSFSNYGSWIDLAAPGEGIWTTSSGGGMTPGREHRSHLPSPPQWGRLRCR